MDIKIIDASESVSYLKQIKALSGLNEEHLGVITHQMIEDSYSRNEVFIAIVDEQFAGYLLYRCAPRYRQYNVVQICIERHFRGEGMSTLLIDRLKDISIEANYKGISLNCRSDVTELNKVWEGNLFHSIEEKPNRTGSTTNPVTFWWWKNTMCRDLFGSVSVGVHVTSVALDTNILIALKENDSGVMHLLNDSWVNEADFFVTNESLNEIDKIEDQAIRNDTRHYFDKFQQLDFHKSSCNNYVKELKAVLENDSDQDISNIKQLAQTLASGADIFITADEGILANAQKLNETYDVKIFHASKLLNYLNEVSYSEIYQPARLSEVAVELRQLKTHEISSAVATFRHASENKASLVKMLQASLDDSSASEVLLISTGKTMLAIVAIADVDRDESIINLFRVLDSELAFTLSSQILNFILKRQAKLKIAKLWIVDEYSSLTKTLAHSFGFKEVHNHQFKLFKFGRDSSAKLSSSLDQKIQPVNFPSFKLSELPKVLEAEPFALEKTLWPVKITDIDVPIYVIPIKAHWAMQLFDEEIASEDIFSPDSSLAFNVENVYFSATKTVIETPGRIVWYVSDADSKSPLSGHIRAISYLDKVDFGMPKSLYKKYKHLGIYDWSEVLKIASNKYDKEICAMTFSRTELLHSPISLDQFNVMAAALGHEKVSLVGPLEIDTAMFKVISESL